MTKKEPDGDIDEDAVYISTESVEVIAEDKEEATEEYFRSSSECASVCTVRTVATGNKKRN